MAKVLVKVSPKTGDPIKPKGSGDNDMLLTPHRGKIETDLDLRDRLATLALKGNSLNPDDKAGIYGDLTSVLGKEKAQKLMNHAYLFNSRPDMQGLSPEDKLKSFYTIGSNDPDVQSIIGRTKNLGYGVIPGFRNSIVALNQNIQQGIPSTATGAVSPEIQKKVMVRIAK